MAKSKRRWSGKGGLVHIVDQQEPTTLCGIAIDSKMIWQLKPGMAHEICITCQKRNQ